MNEKVQLKKKQLSIYIGLNRSQNRLNRYQNSLSPSQFTFRASYDHLHKLVR